MKNLKKVLFVVVFILIAFVGGMFFANKQTEPEITSTLIQNRIEQASDLVTTKYHYAKVGKFENSLSLNGWSIPLTNKNFILTFEGEIQLGTDLSKANIEINDSTIHVTVNKPTVLSNSIDESSIEVYDETKNIFNPISVSDYKAFAVEQKDKALSEAKMSIPRTQSHTVQHSEPPVPSCRATQSINQSHLYTFSCKMYL